MSCTKKSEIHFEKFSSYNFFNVFLVIILNLSCFFKSISSNREYKPKTKLMRTKTFMMIAALFLLILTSCKKNSSLIDQSSLELADDDAITDVVYDDIFNTADYASILIEMVKGDTKSELVVTDSCPEITVERPSGEIWPKVVTIDYGSGCTGFHDNTRSGKIIIQVTGPRHQEGSKRIVTFDNYFFNEMKVEGTKTLESKGFNTNQNFVVSAELVNGKITLPDGKTIERTVSHEREWIAGFSTMNVWDDECLVTGTASGKNIRDVEYTNTIISALHWKRVCRFIVAGTIKIEREGLLPIELNYGTGDCDAKAVITRGDESKEILLGFRHKTQQD